MVRYLIVRNRLPPLSIAPRMARFVGIFRLEIKKLFLVIQLRGSVNIHHYSPPLRWIIVKCFHQVLATVADPNLGGRHFDELLRDHFIEEFKVSLYCLVNKCWQGSSYSSQIWPLGHMVLMYAVVQPVLSVLLLEDVLGICQQSGTKVSQNNCGKMQKDLSKRYSVGFL